MKYITYICLIVTSFILFTSQVSAAESVLDASIDTKDSTKPVLVLTNKSTEPCQIVNTSLGTVSITNAVQDGRAIKPFPVQVSLDDGLEIYFEKNLKTLQPNESVEIPLEVYKYKSDYALQTVTWSKMTGGYGLMYPFKKDRAFTYEVTYAAPFVTTSGAPLCPPVTAKTNTGFPFHRYIIPVTIAFIVIVIIILFLFLIRSKKNKKKVVTAAFIFALLISSSRPVQADYSINEGYGGALDNCFALFNRYPDITEDILNQLDSHQIDIFVNHSGVNDATDWPDGSYHIRWDPESEYDYHSDGDNPVPSTPCDRLFHELYHLYEIMNGTISRDDCGGIPQSEVNATRAQNRLREAMGLPPRTHYGHDRLPTGDGCEDEDPPPPSPGCGFSCSSSWGEPHLKTFDGKSYDFQAVGEFIAAKDPTGDFEVQVRQQPWSTSRYVAMNTAVAMRVGKDIVELKLDNYQFLLIVNGKVEPFKTKDLGNGASITTSKNNHAVVTWPDNTKVTVNSYSTFGLDIFIELSEKRKNGVSGIFGNFNGDAGDDLVLQGTSSPVEADFEILYPKYADSWRVQDKQSLFTYEKGMNTYSYTDKTFPEKYINPNELTNKEFAEHICKNMGITEKTLLQSCILDVGLTGRPEFAYAASKVQQAFSTTVKNYGGQSWNIQITQPGGVQNVSFAGKANEKVFVDFSQSTLPAQCGNVRLLKPDNQLLAEGCVVSGDGIIETTTLPEDGTYTISVSTLPKTTGSGFLQLVHVEDQIENITLNTPVAVKIDTPGKNAELRFNAKTGEIYTVVISRSTLPAQCGGYGAEGPDGAGLGSSCLVQDSATFDTIPIPKDGNYKIILNPTGRAMGEAMVELKKK